MYEFHEFIVLCLQLFPFQSGKLAQTHFDYGGSLGISKVKP